MFVIKCYGESCNYYVGTTRGLGVRHEPEAHRFATEDEARWCGRALFLMRKIGHWEVRRTATEKILAA